MVSPVFHVPHCQLIWQRWESWQPSGGLELRLCAEVWNGRDLILHVMRPNRAGREIRLASPLRQRIKPPAACLSCFNLPLQWPSLSTTVRENWKGCSVLQLGQQPRRSQCKYIHLFIHLFNIYQKLAMCLVLCKVLGCKDKQDTLFTRDPSQLGGGSGNVYVSTVVCMWVMQVHFKPAKASCHKHFSANHKLYN